MVRGVKLDPIALRPYSMSVFKSNLENEVGMEMFSDCLRYDHTGLNGQNWFVMKWEML